MNAPKTRMDILTKKEITDLVDESDIASKYNEEMDRESAYELLKKKLEKARSDEHKEEMLRQREEEKKSTTTKSKKTKKEPSFLEKASKNTLVRQLGRTVFRELTRGILGALGVKK